MDRERRISPWINIVGLFLILLLTGEVILLIRENSELRTRLKSFSDASSGQLVQPGDIITPFSYQLPSADSGIYTFDSWAPNTLVFLFSTTCPFCEDNIPKWAWLDKENLRSDINILGICVDPPSAASTFIRENDVPYRVVSSYVDTSFQFRNRLVGVPITLLINSTGNISRIWPGLLDNGHLAEILTVLTDTNGLGAAQQKHN
jgi:peroxiredoxin